MVVCISPYGKVFTIGVLNTGVMSTALQSRIPCSRETLETVKSLKRGGENYDTLLRKMADQYDPTREEEV